MADVLSHVGYEVFACCEYAAALPDAHAKAAADPKDKVAGLSYNAFLEGQLLHARNIIDFLLRKPRAIPGRQDLLRTDFGDDWTPTPSGAVGRLNQHYEHINRHLSHLSWDRIDGTREWKYRRISQDVLAVTRAWNQHLATIDRDLYEALAHWLLWAGQALDGMVATGPVVTKTSSSGPTGPPGR